GWPCSTCGQSNPVELDACAGCGTGFLAAMKADEPPLLVLPGVGDVSRLSRAQRLAMAAGVAVLIAVMVLVLGVLLG
ncbi:MAG TPA: hypothetical protein VM433_13250, partial [Mycobacteriales bacterium]|nr:hypothetical protein [Mycobacteriales bacterium]